MSDARTEVLARVAEALGERQPRPEIARAYRQHADSSPAERVALFEQRLVDYKAEVHRVDPTEVRDAVAEQCASRRLDRVLVPVGLPERWRPAAAGLTEDAVFSAPELAACDGVVTGCTLAIAETGTLILTGQPDEGRRAITLVPDVHICIVDESQVVSSVPEALRALADRGATTRPLTFVSGPSATSDIELDRVEGVHGPRTLVVLVICDPTA